MSLFHSSGLLSFFGGLLVHHAQTADSRAASHESIVSRRIERLSIRVVLKIITERRPAIVVGLAHAQALASTVLALFVLSRQRFQTAQERIVGLVAMHSHRGRRSAAMGTALQPGQLYRPWLNVVDRTANSAKCRSGFIRSSGMKAPAHPREANVRQSNRPRYSVNVCPRENRASRDVG
ncbi:hypothetical protein ABIB57_001359 [Devosia sp. UYZn731]